MRKMTIDLQPGDLIKSPAVGVPKVVRGVFVRIDEIRLVLDVSSKEPFKDSLEVTWFVSPVGSIMTGSYGKTVTWEIID